MNDPHLRKLGFFMAEGCHRPVFLDQLLASLSAEKTFQQARAVEVLELWVVGASKMNGHSVSIVQLMQLHDAALNI